MEMTYERAAEILDPEHRENYDSIEPVITACKMGMEALKKQIPAKVNLWENSQFWNCPYCNEVVYRPALLKSVHCFKCGQALYWEDYEAYVSKATGSKVKLSRVSRDRMILYACANAIHQGFQYTDRAGKMNFLKWSYSDFLDHLGKFRRVTRNPASAATTTLRFTVSTIRASATPIPQGTRAAALSSVYFSTEEYAEIPAKASYVDVPATCVEVGSAGNSFAAGEVSEIVDPLPYIKSVANVSETEGGADIESDESYQERIWLAPESYSVAGPEGAYKYWAKTYSSAIGDVVANSNQAAGEVDIAFLLSDGSIPGPETISGLQEFLKNDGIRPLTDKVVVSSPAEVKYSISLTYYIDRSNSPKRGVSSIPFATWGFTKTPGSLIFLHGSRNVRLRSKASLRPVGAFFEAMQNGIYTLGVWRCTPSFLMIRTLRCPSTKISCSEFLIFRPTRKRLSGRCIRSAQQLLTRWSMPRERGETSLCSLAC